MSKDAETSVDRWHGCVLADIAVAFAAVVVIIVGSVGVCSSCCCCGCFHQFGMTQFT